MKLCSDTIETFRPLIRRIITRRLMKKQFDVIRDDVDDLCQEVIVSVIKNVNTLEDTSKLGAWIVGITNNVVNMYYRRKYMHQRHKSSVEESVMTTDRPDDPYEIIYREEIKTHMRLLIADLPVVNRLIIGLHYFDGLKVNDIAKKLSMKPQKISDALSYSKKVLRIKWKPHEKIQK
ncbi:sigma-70 family RNA polymerase sigma factor [bacterium]|nr:sigma-70 family RNA polymerase sigma factor [candidate division CSSED10-310 bacterium]